MELSKSPPSIRLKRTRSPYAQNTGVGDSPKVDHWLNICNRPLENGALGSRTTHPALFKLLKCTAFTLQVKLGGATLDHGHDGGDFFLLLAGLEVGERFVRAGDGFFDSLFVDGIGVDGHVGQHTSGGASDFDEAFANGQFSGLATFGIAQFTGLQSGDKRGVRRQDAHLTFETWKHDGIDVI